MNLQMGKDLTQKAYEDAFDAIMRTVNLSDDLSMRTSVFLSTCGNLLNTLFTHLRNEGMPETELENLRNSFFATIGKAPAENKAIIVNRITGKTETVDV